MQNNLIFVTWGHGEWYIKSTPRGWQVVFHCGDRWGFQDGYYSTETGAREACRQYCTF